MADLGTLRPGAANTTGLPTTGSIIGNPGGSTALSDNSDTTFDGQNTNSSGTYQYGRELADTPGDFSTMATLSVQVRYAWESLPTNSTWDDIAARIVGSNGSTVLAAANSGGTFQSILNPAETTILPTNSSVVAFGYVNTSANKASWDGAIVQLQWVRTRSKGGDSLGCRVYEAFITGTYNPSANVTVTPSTASLTTATFAPTVTATANQLVTPGVVNLTTSAFAPTVTASDHQTVTPGVVALTTSAFAPTVTASDHQTVIPDVAALTTATFAPAVTASEHQTVTPDAASLSLSAFAPTVTATEHQTVTPDVAALSLSTFAPTVSAGGGVTVEPDVAALSLSTFAPSVTTSDNIVVTPAVMALNLAAFAPTVSATANVVVTPTPAALVLAGLAPSVEGDVVESAVSHGLASYRMQYPNRSSWFQLPPDWLDELRKYYEELARNG